MTTVKYLITSCHTNTNTIHHIQLHTFKIMSLHLQMLIKISAQEKFRNWLERAELDCQRTLNSLLLEPIQVQVQKFIDVVVVVF